MLLGQEDHAHAVFAQGRQFHSLRGEFGAVERIGNLQQDAGAVAHQRVGADGAAGVQVLQERGSYSPVAAAALISSAEGVAKWFKAGLISNCIKVCKTGID